MINTLVQIQHLQDFNEQGFFSKTYLGIDKRLNREVAVKDIIYENLTSESEFEKYFEEAYKLSIASHPRIMPVYYVGLDASKNDEIIPRIVTTYYKNGSLNMLLHNSFLMYKTLCLDYIIRYAHDIIQGMIHLHSLDILHLDLKASNIYIGDDFKMVIGDFGQAKFIKEGIILEPKNLYPSTKPLEASTKRSLDKTIDIYQFGLLLYSMLCYDSYRDCIENKYKISSQQLIKIFRDKPSNVDALKKEFKDNMKLFLTAVKNSEFPDRNDFHYYVPKKIQEIICKCLSPKIEERYNNFYEIQTDLNSFQFPDDVKNLYQDLNTNTLYFTKKDNECGIKIDRIEQVFNVTSLKKDKIVKKYCQQNITSQKLQNLLFKFLKEL